MEALFKFVKRVKEGGIDEELWQENKKIDELKFKFKEKEDPAIYARYNRNLYWPPLSCKCFQWSQCRFCSPTVRYYLRYEFV